jgi:hypothetical protein
MEGVMLPAVVTDADRAVVARQLGREPRTLRRVAVRCPFGAPAVTEQSPYGADGEPFPTTYYLTCRYLVAAVSRLEAAGGVERWSRRRARPRSPRPSQPSLRGNRAAPEIAGLWRQRQRGIAREGIGGSRRGAALKYLHAPSPSPAPVGCDSILRSRAAGWAGCSPLVLDRVSRVGAPGGGRRVADRPPRGTAPVPTAARALVSCYTGYAGGSVRPCAHGARGARVRALRGRVLGSAQPRRAARISRSSRATILARIGAALSIQSRNCVSVRSGVKR